MDTIDTTPVMESIPVAPTQPWSAAAANTSVTASGGLITPRLFDPLREAERLTREIAEEPDDPGRWLARARGYLDAAGDLREREYDPVPCLEAAIADCGECLRRDSGCGSAYLVSGTAHEQIGTAQASRETDSRPRMERAVADFTEALARDPSLWEARVRRGLLLERLGRSREALADLSVPVPYVWIGPSIHAAIRRAEMAAADKARRAEMRRERQVERENRRELRNFLKMRRAKLRR